MLYIKITNDLEKKDKVSEKKKKKMNISDEREKEHSLIVKKKIINNEKGSKETNINESSEMNDNKKININEDVRKNLYQPEQGYILTSLEFLMEVKKIWVL